MWANWFAGPLSAKSEVMMSAHPSVKLMANFCGMITMTGRKSVKAMKTKKMPDARKRPKYMSAFPEGKLLVALWKLPGSSRTPLETLRCTRPAGEIGSERGGVGSEP
jgi:hypothetical protein